MPRNSHWSGQDRDGECYRLNVDIDRFQDDESLEVSITIDYHDGTNDHSALAWLTPLQAREVATALFMNANDIERVEQNAST